MWKLLAGFAVFAGLGLYMIFLGGDKVDMGGEQHSVEAHAPEKPAAAVSAAK